MISLSTLVSATAIDDPRPLFSSENENVMLMTMTAMKTWVAGMDSRRDMPSRKASICIPTVGDWADGVILVLLALRFHAGLPIR